MKSPRWRSWWGLKKTTVIIAVIFSLCVVMVTSPSARATETPSQESIAEIDVSIEDACYLDLDLDSFEDDVYVLLRFDLADFDYYEFAYIITLELPSGIEYSYLVYVWAWIDVVYTNNLFYNHATESGNYTVYVDAAMVNPVFTMDYEEYVFDPPGGSEGGKPTFGVH
ncbi:MAG: hypothetical protein GF309_12320 [Candidatus Lokiarchaeota archaeon]|jgi:hypothetical protein|nr:hypothetical protein [Candidatus Lokiarchaeota archaeon]